LSPASGGIYELMHVFKKLCDKIWSSKDSNKLGEYMCGFKFIAGYYSNTPSGTLICSLIHFIVSAAAKFPPAESPTITILFGFILKNKSTYFKIQL